MRIKSHNVAGNVHDAISFLRKTATEEFFHSVVPLGGGSGAIIIWKFENYPAYVDWAKRLKIKDYSSAAEFETGELLK